MMKKIKLISFLGLLILFALTACDKELDIKNLDFDVSIEKTTFKVGDTVLFKFTGNPDNITFFSGETGQNYEYRNRLRAEGKPELQFTSFSEFGTQVNTLQVLATTDFNGIVNENIGNVAWTDITNLVTLSSGLDNTASGVVDLTQFVNDKPLYIAYRFIGQTGSTQKRWTIKNFLVQNKLNDGSVLKVADITTAGFSQVSLKNSSVVWSISSDQIRIQGGPATNEDNDDWIVTKPLYLDRVSPDTGTALKNITSKLTKYSYVFSRPGTYKVAFIASNSTADKSVSIVKELTITVTP
jgi:hypothetical protein